MLRSLRQFALVQHFVCAGHPESLHRKPVATSDVPQITPSGIYHVLHSNNHTTLLHTVLYGFEQKST